MFIDINVRSNEDVIGDYARNYFWNRLVEVCLLNSDVDQSQCFRCPLSLCTEEFSCPNKMLLHLKECKCLSYGSSKRPMRGTKDGYSTISNKKSRGSKATLKERWESRVESLLSALGFSNRRTGSQDGLHCVGCNCLQRTGAMKPYLADSEQNSFTTGYSTEDGGHAAIAKVNSDERNYEHHAELSGEDIPAADTTFGIREVDPIQDLDTNFNLAYELPTDTVPSSSKHPSRLSSIPMSPSRRSSTTISPASSNGSTNRNYTIIGSNFDPFEQLHNLDKNEGSYDMYMQESPVLPTESLDQNHLSQIRFYLPDKVSSPYPWNSNISSTPTTADHVFNNTGVRPERPSRPCIDTSWLDMAVPTFPYEERNHSVEWPHISSASASSSTTSGSYVNVDTGDLNSPQAQDLELDYGYTTSPTLTSATSSTNSDESPTEVINNSEELIPRLKCKFCDFVPGGKPENGKAYLRKHIKTHGTSTVSCPECGKVYTRQDNLTTHWNKTHRPTDSPVNNVTAVKRCYEGESGYEQETLQSKKTRADMDHDYI